MSDDNVNANEVLNKIRTAILDKGVKNRKSKIINIFDVDVELRSPTLEEMQGIRERSDRIPPYLQVLIEYTYVPGTDTPVFTEADVDAIKDLQSGDWYYKLNEGINELLGVSVKDEEKN